MKKIYLLFFLFFLISCSYSVSSMELCVIYNNQAVPNTLVRLWDDWGDEYKYMTDSGGRISANLIEGYYYIKIDIDDEKIDDYYRVVFDETIYLYEEKLNFIECKQGESTPGFGIILAIFALGIVLYIKNKKT